MHLDLNPLQTRVLGCLLEKERTTPEAYPLTLNSVTAAVNQTSNRDPILSVDTAEVEEALEELRTRKVATLVMMAGARTAKFRHQLLEHYDLNQSEIAIVCVLLLRGPQTLGELKVRTERLHAFEDTVEIEGCLVGMESGDQPLVRQLPQRPGQKGSRWVQLLSGEPEVASAPVDFTESSARPLGTAMPLSVRVGQLEADLAALRQEFAEFRKQFES